MSQRVSSRLVLGRSVFLVLVEHGLTVDRSGAVGLAITTIGLCLGRLTSLEEQALAVDDEARVGSRVCDRGFGGVLAVEIGKATALGVNEANVDDRAELRERLADLLAADPVLELLDVLCAST